MEENKTKSFVDKVWDLFASITFAVVLFALIALTSIVGTVIEQNVEPAKNIKLLGRLFGESLAPTLYTMFEKLGFMDMYRSWWFLVLLVLFAINLIICSLDRLPRIWKLAKEPIKPLTDEQFKNLGKKEIVLKTKVENTKGTVISAIKNTGLKAVELKEANGYQFYAEKGNYTRLGVYITHLSILLILVGALIGIRFGFKGFLNLPEGKTYSAIVERGGRYLSPAQESEMEAIFDTMQKTYGNVPEAARHLGTDELTLRTKMKHYGIRPLGFSLRCDNFLVDYYGRSNMPKEYRSWLTVIKDGKVALQKSIVVNDPLTYEGITFYQSSFGTTPDAHSEIIIKITSNTGVSETKQFHINDKFIIPGTDLEGTIKEFSPALSIDPTGRAFTYAEQMSNPAVFVEFSEKGKIKYAGWILKRQPNTWLLPEKHTVELVDVWGIEYTGLQVRNDPGVGIVYLGCIVMAVGLYITFFMSHKKIWVRVSEEKNNTRVSIAFTANKNKAAFERKIDKMTALLNKSEGGGK